jgi:hypothetical protein
VDQTFDFVAAYLACHLLAYAAVFRRVAWLRTERGIFLLHAVSFLAFGCGLALQALLGGGAPGLAAPHLVLALSLHGIYSLSFLELWSLTQGSYSLAILALVARSRTAATPQALASLGAIGPMKKSARAGGLASLGLLRQSPGGGATLTPAGAAVARLVRALLWFSGGRALNR